MTRQNRLVYGIKTPTGHVFQRAQRAVTTALLLVFFVFSLPAVASTTISEEFSTKESFTAGSLVSINREDPSSVELATIGNGAYLFGVVIAEDEGSVTFSKNNASTTVALTGEVQVFVSDANGQVKKGDFVGASWLEGVGMKSLETDKQKLLGVALEDFDASRAKNYGDIDTSTGEQNIHIDVITVRLFDKEGMVKSDSSASGLEKVLNGVAGKQVSLAKVLASSILFLITLIVAGMFIMSSIRGSFISIGRNPMASASIYKSLLHVSGLSVLVLIIGTALTYVVLVV